jgi:hypothetical protein
MEPKPATVDVRLDPYTKLGPVIELTNNAEVLTVAA